MPPRPPRKCSSTLAAATASVAILASLSGCSGGSSSTSSGAAQTPSSAQTPGASGFDGAALPPGVLAPDFNLADERGQVLSLARLRGQVVIVAFVYAACGAPCVVIAQQIRGALDEISRPVPVLLISADPATDTPARVGHFLARVSLTGRVRYLSGSPAQLRPVWRAFRVIPASAGRAAFARSASVYVIDRAGHERVIYQLEQLTPEALAHDVRKLLADG